MAKTTVKNIYSHSQYGDVNYDNKEDLKGMTIYLQKKLTLWCQLAPVPLVTQHSIYQINTGL